MEYGCIQNYLNKTQRVRGHRGQQKNEKFRANDLIRGLASKVTSESAWRELPLAGFGFVLSHSNCRGYVRWVEGENSGFVIGC